GGLQARLVGAGAVPAGRANVVLQADDTGRGPEHEGEARALLGTLCVKRVTRAHLIAGRVGRIERGRDAVPPREREGGPDRALAARRGRGGSLGPQEWRLVARGRDLTIPELRRK